MFILLTGSNILAQNAKSEYSVVNKIHLPGDGGWDYLSVDEIGGRLFVSHGTVVQVVDLKTGQLAGTVNETPGVHGIAIAQDLNKANIRIMSIVKPETPIGNHTGAIHGLGMRNNTSIVVNFGGHLIRT